MPQQPLPEEILQLIKVYQDAQVRLVEQIKQKEAKGNLTNYERAILSQVDEQIKALDKFTIDWTEKNIPKFYELGMSVVNRYIERKGIGLNLSNVFSKLHTTAINELMFNMVDKMVKATNYVGREMKDNIREAGLNAIAQKLSMGETVKYAKKELMDKLTQQGVTAIRRKDGRLIRLDSYSALVARSTSREAQNRGTMNQLTEHKFDLVKMSSHYGACPICTVLQGRVYSISGNDTRFPPLKKAYTGIYANIHPNCRHVLTPYIEKFNDVDKDVENSNREFAIREEDRASIEKYNAEQKKNAELTRDRRQWEQYKQVLGNDAPKTLSAFRRMKQAGSDKWKDISSKYKIETKPVRDLKKVPKNVIIKRGHISQEDFFGSKFLGQKESIELVRKDLEKASGQKITFDEAKEMKSAVSMYSGSSYASIRMAQTNPDNAMDLYIEAGKNIEKYIKLAPKWNDGQLFRGINLPKDVIEQLNLDSEIDMIGVSSWSSLETKAITFSKKGDNSRVIFNLPQTKNGVSITHLSQFDSEKEVIISKDAKFIIKKIEKKDINGDKYTFIDVEEVD